VDTEADVYAIELICQTKPFKKQKWQMELSSQQIGLRDSEGDNVLMESPEVAVERLDIPGFASENSHLGMNLGEMKLSFKIAKQDLEIVRQYVDTVVAASGLQDIERVHKVAIKQLTWGGLGLVSCLVILLLMVVGGVKEDVFKFFGMGAFWGLIFACKGFAGLKRHRQLVAMREETLGY